MPFRALLLLVFSVFAFMAAGCGPSYPAIEGKWKENGVGDITLEFSKDSMYLTMGNSRIAYGKYKFIDKDTIEVELSEFAMKAKIKGAETRETFKKADAAISGEKYTPPDPKKANMGNVERLTVKVEGDNFSMKDEDGKTTEMKRSN